MLALLLGAERGGGVRLRRLLLLSLGLLLRLLLRLLLLLLRLLLLLLRLLLSRRRRFSA